MIIGIIGQKGTGKDTVADYIVKSNDFKKISYAEPLKKICKELFDLTDEQLNDQHEKEKIDPRWGMSPRTILQSIGTDLFRKHYDENFWVNILIQKIKNKNDNFIISDIRHQNELDILCSNFKFENILILRLFRKNDIVDHHSTEKNVYDIDVSNVFYVDINNNSTKDALYDSVSQILSSFKK